MPGLLVAHPSQTPSGATSLSFYRSEVQRARCRYQITLVIGFVSMIAVQYLAPIGVPADFKIWSSLEFSKCCHEPLSHHHHRL